MLSSIHGWSPIGNSDEDVHISQDMYFMTIESTCTPLAGVTSITSSSDRRAQRNRNRDPSWIPRPRNAFIIFRCEYSHQHSQASQETLDVHDSTNPTVKTLSKRAAEAWKELPPSERERYKSLADKEREEHARLYPHYRFRPMKRQLSGTVKTTSQEHSKRPRIPSIERPSSAPRSAHLPSVLAPAPEKARSSPPELLVQPVYEVSAPVSGTTTEPFHEQSYSIDDWTEPQMMPLTTDYNDFRSYTLPDLYDHDLVSPFLFPEYY